MPLPPKRARNLFPRSVWVVALALLVVGLRGLGAQVPQYSQPSPTPGAEGAAADGRLRFPGAPYSAPDRLFLNRGVWQGYLNYGSESYETYTVSTRSFEIYDRLGHRLLRGYPLATWEESRSADLNAQRSSVVRAQQFWQWFDSVILLQDGYKGWNLAMMSGDKLRTTLTPLTLSQPRWDGIRLDGESNRHGFTILLSRGQDRRFSAFQAREETNPVLSYGGRWQTRFAQVLTAGLTLFNQHEADLRSNRGDLRRGTVPLGMEVPTRIVVRVQDDAPEDAVPAAVYGLDVHLRVIRPDGTRGRLTSAAEPLAGEVSDPGLQALVSGRQQGDHYEAQGPAEAVDFEFPLPAGMVVEGARFSAEVAGDYRIAVRQNHQYFNEDARTPAWEERQWPARPIRRLHNLEGRPDFPIDFKPTEAKSFYTMVRSRRGGAVESPRTVWFDYGFPVGQTLVGSDFALEARGITARGELVYNLQDYQFPLNSDSFGLAGRYFDSDAFGGYLTAVKRLGPRLGSAELGVEVFRMDPDFGGGYDARRGGAVLSTDVGGDFEVSGTRRNYAGFTQEFELVADNDDGDDWADDHPAEEGDFQPFQPQVYSGAKAHSGVFPGLDADGDNTPDTDRNRNGVPDWNEPFLLYGSDPPDFVYGIDFNNNGVADQRENDAEPDYPYRRDSRGWHGFAALPDPLPLVRRLSAGVFAMRQVAAPGRARGAYLRVQHRSAYRGVQLEFDDDLKVVRDSIRDDVYIFDVTAAGNNTGSILSPPPPDPLSMRRSLVNTAMFQVLWAPAARLHLRGQVLHQANQQAELELPGGGLQEAAVLGNLTAIGRADYACQWGRLDLWTGIKAMAREGDGSGAGEPGVSLRFFAPILRLSYPFMANVTLQGGLSGFAFLPMRLVDGHEGANSYRQHNTVCMLNSTTGDYLGYTLSTSIGVQWQTREYDRPDPLLDAHSFGFFVETYAGF